MYNENMHIYIGEFIMNNEVNYLYENMLELWIELYLSYDCNMLNYLDNAIDIIENATKNDIIISPQKRNIYHIIANLLYDSQPKKYKYYVKQQIINISNSGSGRFSSTGIILTDGYKLLFKTIMNVNLPFNQLY